jgi:hypothetical protein
MKNHDRNSRTRGGVLPVWLLLGVMLCGLVVSAQPVVAQVDLSGESQNLEELLSQVGEDYAVSYSSPFLYSFGPNANSNMYSTAHIPWTTLVFGFGVKVMTTQLNEDDQYFSKLVPNVDLSTYDPAIPAGTMGDVYLSGPTIFGDTGTNGRIQGLVNGVEVFNAETIPGLVDTRWSPLFAPEAYIGGVMGFKLTVRYLPEIDTGDLGKTKYWGYGLQWNANGVLKTLPVDVMAGFFTQEINVGSVYESTASTFFAAASKSYTLLTVYGGIALEDSNMDVAYEFVHPTDPNLNANVAFNIEGVQDTRLTLGATLDFLAKLNVELGLGNKLTSYSAGLMFGF